MISPALSSSSLICFSMPFNLLLILSTVFFISLTIFFLSDYSLYFLFVIPWTVACQAPLSMRLPRQQYWRGLPFPSPGHLPDPEMEPAPPALVGGFFTTGPPGKPQQKVCEVKVAQSCPTLRDPMGYSPWNSPGQNTGGGSLSLLQGIFPSEGLNLGLLYCRGILYQLSHKYGSTQKHMNVLSSLI